MRLAFVAPRIVDAVAAVACRPVLPCKWSVSADRRLEAGNSQRISLRSLLLRAGNAIETDCEALLPRHHVFWRFRFVVGSGRAKMGLPLLLERSCRISGSGSWRTRRTPSSNVAELCGLPSESRAIRAIRLRVANYNTTLSSNSLETGTDSSNSLPSTIQSLSFRTVRIRSKSARLRRFWTKGMDPS